jgi:hypothetical protein
VTCVTDSGARVTAITGGSDVRAYFSDIETAHAREPAMKTLAIFYVAAVILLGVAAAAAVERSRDMTDTGIVVIAPGIAGLQSR